MCSKVLSETNETLLKLFFIGFSHKHALHELVKKSVHTRLTEASHTHTNSSAGRPVDSGQIPGL